ncbi:dTMP kinase [Solimonas aquatica]|uniref:Thymidylate kinase n=1 Tax=Solimonas aquatica TaxID=489703 RepID=A0A1H9HT08_9GAMM|nr:dTMP kinase [Solimonas aquatica]SEQ65460.1 dTMP kinase [Solimonas aquatica]
MSEATSARGRLITLEGGEGAGKSTQARFVRDWLTDRGREVLLTREPGGSPLAEAIRGVVLGDWAEGVTPECEITLMFAARAAHWHATILPALQAGRDVVCDRFIDSSYAYQVWGKQVSLDAFNALQQLVLGEQRPDLTLLLDLDAELGLARARDRGDENRFEAESQQFRQRVREGFLTRAREEPQRVRVVNAECEAEQVSAQIAVILAEWSAGSA